MALAVIRQLLVLPGGGLVGKWFMEQGPTGLAVVLGAGFSGSEILAWRPLQPFVLSPWPEWAQAEQGGILSSPKRQLPVPWLSELKRSGVNERSESSGQRKKNKSPRPLAVLLKCVGHDLSTDVEYFICDPVLFCYHVNWFIYFL